LPHYGLEGSVVAITGAGSGIGRGLAAAFAAQGASLALIDRDTPQLHRTASELETRSNIRSYVCDLSSDQDVSQLQKNVRADFPKLDVLVNNAGAEYPTPVESNEIDAMNRWSELLNNNVTTMMRVTRALLPLLSSSASVINQSSIWGLVGISGFSAYVASKHAVVGLTRSLAWELAPRGIRVNAVCPGWIKTEASLRSLRHMARTMGRSEDAMLKEILAAQAMPALLEPADIAGVYLFLASQDSAVLTGQALVASRGEVMH
jgi:3-hydroxybutyrate dehydrogenase